MAHPHGQVTQLEEKLATKNTLTDLAWHEAVTQICSSFLPKGQWTAIHLAVDLYVFVQTGHEVLEIQRQVKLFAGRSCDGSVKALRN